MLCLVERRTMEDDLPRRQSPTCQRHPEPLRGFFQAAGKRNLRNGNSRRHLSLQAVRGGFLNEATQAIEYEYDELRDGLT